jgi:hypothetical protein
LWVLDHLDDLESDFSVFHRIDNMYDLPAREFLAKAERLAAYTGVMQARVVAEERERAEGGESGMPQYRSDQVAARHPSTPSQGSLRAAPELTPATAVGNGYGADGGLAAIVEWGGG